MWILNWRLHYDTRCLGIIKFTIPNSKGIVYQWGTRYPESRQRKQCIHLKSVRKTETIWYVRLSKRFNMGTGDLELMEKLRMRDVPLLFRHIFNTVILVLQLSTFYKVNYCPGQIIFWILKYTNLCPNEKV